MRSDRVLRISAVDSLTRLTSLSRFLKKIINNFRVQQLYFVENRSYIKQLRKFRNETIYRNSATFGEREGKGGGEGWRALQYSAHYGA